MQNYEEPIVALSDANVVKPLGIDLPGIDDLITRIRTRVQWQDSNGRYHAVRGAQVRIFDDKDRTREVGFARTDEQGYLDTLLSQPISDGEVYFTVFANGRDYRVNPEEGENVYVFRDDGHSVDSSGSTSYVRIPYDSGLVDLNERAFSVNDAAFVADKFYNNFLSDILVSPLSTSSLPNNIRLIRDYDWWSGAKASYHYATNEIIVGDTYAYDWDVFFHEYGHFLMWQNEWRTLDQNLLDDNRHYRGVSNITGGTVVIPWNFDVDIPARNKTSALRMSFSEGGADYIALAIQDVAKANGWLPNIPHVGDYRIKIGDEQIDIENGNGLLAEGEGDELAVSRILWDLADNNADTFNSGLRDNVALGHKALFAAFEETSVEKLDDIWDALTENASYRRKADMGAIFEEYNVAPSPELVGGRVTVFESGTTPDLLWDPGSEVVREGTTVEANDLFKGYIFNSDFSQIVLEGTPTRSLGWQPDNWESLNEGEIYNFVVEGIDDRKGINGQAYDSSDITGGYWSGARQFSIGSATGTIDTRALKKNTQLLADVKQGLQQADALARLPLLGDLESNQTLIFLDNIQTGLTSELLSLNDIETSARLKQAFLDGLVKGGVQLLSDDIDVVEADDGSTRFDFSIGNNFSLSSQSMAANLGLPGLGFDLSASGGLDLNVGYDFDFSIDIARDGKVAFKTPKAEDLTLSLKAVVPDGQLSGKLGFLQITAESDRTAPSSIDLQLGIDLDNSTVRDVDMGGTVDLNLDLRTSFSGSRTLPSLLADFDLDWNLGSDKPAVAFNDVRLDAGSFISKFASPVLQNVQSVTQRLQPVVDLLNKEVNLGVKKVKMADLFGSNAGLVKSLGDVTSLVNKIPTSTNQSLEIALGSFDLGAADISQEGFLLERASPNVTVSAPSFSSQVSALSSSTEKEFFTQLQVGEGAGLAFPLLSDRTQAFNLLLGKDASLFTYDMPALSIGANTSLYIPIFGPLGARLEGEANATADINFGFDTYGLRKVADGHAASHAFDGFYLTPDSGLDLDASVSASAELNAVVASAGAGGGITGSLDLDLRDPNGNGRVHLDEFSIANPFEASGRVVAGLHAYVKVGWGWFSYTKRFKGPQTTLIDWGSASGSTNRTTNNSANNNSVKVGSTSNAVSEDPHEKPAVVQLLGVASTGKEVAYERFGTYGNDRLEGSQGTDFFIGGAGADDMVGGSGFDVATYETSTSGVTINLATGYGSGDAAGDVYQSIEQIEGSYYADALYGSASDDVFDGLSGNDIMSGGGGNDTFIGGAGADNIDGGSGSDLASYSLSSKGVTINLQTRTASGGEAQGDRLTSIENIEGSEYRDTLKGNADNNMLIGLGGDDVLEGGAGEDTLIGGEGRDRFTIRGGGNDTIVDFERGRDRLWADVEFFSELRFVQSGSNALMQLESTGQTLATLKGIGAASIGEEDFANSFFPEEPSSPSPSPIPDKPGIGMLY